jgi:SRSO17 transposase
VYRPAQELAAELPASAWQPTAEERAWGHGRVVRRRLEDPSKLAYDVAFAPREGTTLETLIQVAGRRWTIEVGFERAKQDCGLDEYEGRTLDAWHRHITVALLAQAFLVAMSAQAKKGALRPT